MNKNDTVISIALPKGCMQEGVFRLLADAGLPVGLTARCYRPSLPLAGFDTKILKPQNIVEMLHLGSRDVGFAGADWVAELRAETVELLDTGLDPVRVVAAAHQDLLVDGRLPDRKLVVASEYERLTQEWIRKRELSATFVRSYGATEVFPPEDADCIVDNTATGSTLQANDLQVTDIIMSSTTRLYANPRSLENPEKRERIENLCMVLRSVLEARQRVMVELNVGPDQLEAVIEILPCMRKPTVAGLHGEIGFAVRAAVPKPSLPTLIPQIKALGGTDVVVSSLAQIVP